MADKNTTNGQPKFEKLTLQDVREIEAKEIVDDIMEKILEIK